MQAAHFLGTSAAAWAARFCHLAADLNPAPTVPDTLPADIVAAVSASTWPPAEPPRTALAQPLFDQCGADVLEMILDAHPVLASQLPLGAKLARLPPCMHARAARSCVRSSAPARDGKQRQDASHCSNEVLNGHGCGELRIDITDASVCACVLAHLPQQLPSVTALTFVGLERVEPHQLEPNAGWHCVSSWAEREREVDTQLQALDVLVAAALRCGFQTLRFEGICWRRAPAFAAPLAAAAGVERVDYVRCCGVGGSETTHEGVPHPIAPLHLTRLHWDSRHHYLPQSTPLPATLLHLELHGPLAGGASVVNACTRLRHLSLRGTTRAVIDSLRAFRAIGSFLETVAPQLTHLDIRSCGRRCAPRMARVLRTATALRSLDISSGHRLSADGATACISALAGVRHLSYLDVSNGAPYDAAILELAAHAHSWPLHTLRLVGAECGAGAVGALLRSVAAIPTLRTLALGSRAAPNSRWQPAAHVAVITALQSLLPTDASAGGAYLTKLEWQFSPYIGAQGPVIGSKASLRLNSLLEIPCWVFRYDAEALLASATHATALEAIDSLAPVHAAYDAHTCALRGLRSISGTLAGDCVSAAAQLRRYVHVTHLDIHIDSASPAELVAAARQLACVPELRKLELDVKAWRRHTTNTHAADLGRALALLVQLRRLSMPDGVCTNREEVIALSGGLRCLQHLTRMELDECWCTRAELHTLLPGVQVALQPQGGLSLADVDGVA